MLYPGKQDFQIARLMLFLGEGKPSPRPPPKSAARQEVRMRFISARSAWEGVWGRACPPPQAISYLENFL